MRILVLAGAGGHGKVVADAATILGWKEIIFVDDCWPKRTRNGVWPVVGTLAEISEYKGRGHSIFVSIGTNAKRAEVAAGIGEDEMPVIRHPSAVFSKYSEMGAGTLICAGAVVNIDSQIGRGVILNTGCSVDHDCTISDFAHISPGARLGGNVAVGVGAWVGIGAAVREGIKIGDGAKIGAGAAVVSDIPDHALAVGVPARIISEQGCGRPPLSSPR